MKLKSIIFLKLMLIGLSANCQDPIFTHTNYIPETVNPGFTGFEDKGRFYAGILSRLQWPGLDSRLNTQYLFANQSFEANNFDYGLGVNFIWQNESFNNYNFYQLNISYAQRIRLSEDLYFRPGVEVGVGNKRNNFGALTLGDQININTGVISPQSIDPLARNTRNFFYPDISTGIVLERVESQNDISYWLGISLRHINTPDVSFVEDEKVPLDVLLAIQFNYRFPFINDDNRVLITANYLRQGRSDRFDIGPLFQFDRFLLGITAATNPSSNSISNHLLTSVNGFFGLEYTKFRFGVSYDMNTSKIGNTKGVYEFSMTFLSDCKYCKRNRQRKR